MTRREKSELITILTSSEKIKSHNKIDIEKVLISNVEPVYKI